MIVSVIIPCYNVRAFIEECLHSVFSQDFPPLEVICVDNNSTDGTWDKLEELKTNNYPGLVILREPAKGAAAARNKGLSVAGGQWIQFLDADDLLKPAKIGQQVKLLERAAPSVGFIVGSSEKHAHDGTVTPSPQVNADRFVAPFINQAGNTCANLWNRDYLQRVGGWDTGLSSSQEADLMLRMVLLGAETMIDPTVNTIIRTRESGQISQSDPTRRWCHLIDVRMRYLQQLSVRYEKEYKLHRQTFLNYLMSTVLILGQYDRKIAYQYFERIKQLGWTPKSAFGISRIKGIIIRSLGLDSYFTLQSFVRSKGFRNI